MSNKGNANKPYFSAHVHVSLLEKCVIITTRIFIFSMLQGAYAAPGDMIEQFDNSWAYSTIGLAYDPVRHIVRYAHESQSSSHNPTIYDVAATAPHTLKYSVALSAQNPGWPWQVDNRDGATYDSDTGTYFLPDYNGDLSYRDDNIVEIDVQGNLQAYWETDTEVGGPGLHRRHGGHDY